MKNKIYKILRVVNEWDKEAFSFSVKFDYDTEGVILRARNTKYKATLDTNGIQDFEMVEVDKRFSTFDKMVSQLDYSKYTNTVMEEDTFNLLMYLAINSNSHVKEVKFDVLNKQEHTITIMGYDILFKLEITKDRFGYTLKTFKDTIQVDTEYGVDTFNTFLEILTSYNLLYFEPAGVLNYAYN